MKIKFYLMTLLDINTVDLILLEVTLVILILLFTNDANNKIS